MSASIASKLFTPIKVGNIKLQHRVVLAPLTRFKASKTGHVPTLPLVKTYYEQRGSVPGTLLITEATLVAPQAGGYAYVPGIWNSDQIKAWKEVTDAVHAKGSYIFMQLWALGRAANPAVLAEEGLDYVSASDIPLTMPARDPPRPLTLSEIDDYVGYYAQAAKNAVLEAGFDGVEIHGANGYLIDQFMQDTSNRRTDDYGGSVENRSRFALRVVDAVVNAVGVQRTAVRISPWGRYQDMKMEDPKPQFSHFVKALKEKHPDLAYLHAIQPPQIEGSVLPGESNDFLRDIWAPKPYISAGDQTRETALEAAEKGDIVAFGRTFLATPDLPYRLQHNIPANELDTARLYVKADVPGTEKGYTDYPFSEQFLESQRAASVHL